MIELDRVSLTYADAAAPTLREVSLTLDEGELVLVTGATGSGKSTLLGLLNGVVPQFTGGHLDGGVTIAGRDVRTASPRELADVVGVVGQDPLASFVTDTVEEELAYGMEQLAVPGPLMRKRVEETLDLLGIAELRSRALVSLSGGQQQRVAIGAVLGSQPRILVLDEPTSALDPVAAEEVLATLTRLVHDLGLTVVVAEHRLERVVQYADRMLEVRDGRVQVGTPADILADSALAPPVVRLGRLAGWSPLPLSVREARRSAGPLRESLAAAVPPAAGPHDLTEPVLTGRGVVVRYGELVAVRGVDLSLDAGTVTALMGRNGSGKSSLLWAWQGAGRRAGRQVAGWRRKAGLPSGEGSVSVRGVDPAGLADARRRALIGLVPQVPSDLLYLDSVAEECAAADEEAGVASGSCRQLFERLAGVEVPPDRHPRDLSEGQRLALVLAVQILPRPPVVLLDEPTRGLDYPGKAVLAGELRRLAATGTAICLASHDVEFVASVADRVVVLAEGEIVADGAAAGILVGSAAFAPQVAKTLFPAPWLTVEQVAEAIGVPGTRTDP